MMTANSSFLVNNYDAALFDLDGVVYLGPKAIFGVSDAFNHLRQLGMKIGFVTNNAARSPQTVANHLNEIGIAARPDDIVTSAQAAARLLAENLLLGSRVHVVGTQALADEVAKVKMKVVWDSKDHPDAVIQGYDPEMTFSRLRQACYSIQAGAKWFVTNTDLNRPTDKGIVPGAGAQVYAVSVSVDSKPLIAGKPYKPLLDETVRRLHSQRPIFVGDRIDTDIMGADAAGMDSLFVFTGTHGKNDLAVAPINGRPTFIGHNIGALLKAARRAEVSEFEANCNGQKAIIFGKKLDLISIPTSYEKQLDALWALLQLIWQHPECDFKVIEKLSLVP